MTRRDYVTLMAGLIQTFRAAPRAAAQPVPEPDPRNIANGYRILADGYSDQPYAVITRDGNWLCVVTTGTGKEGDPGQHIVSTISADKGRTWSAPIDIEPAGGFLGHTTGDAERSRLRFLYL
jgi:hypothetical protein